MKDFNFFSPYIEVRRNFKEKILQTVLVGIACLSIFFGFAIWNQYRIWNLEKDIRAQEEVLSSQETIQRVKEYQSMTEKVKFLTDYHKILQDANEKLDQSDIINSGYMADISNSLPSGTFLNALVFNQGTIQLQGISESRIAVAELQHNLKALNKMKNVHIDNISYEDITEKTFVFNITCELGAMKQDEAK